MLYYVLANLIFSPRAEVDRARLEILAPLSAMSSEQSAYRKGFSHISRLAVLHEVELLTGRLLLRRDAELLELELLLQELEARLNYTLISWTNLDPILRVRRAILNLGTGTLISSGLRCSCLVVILVWVRVLVK